MTSELPSDFLDLTKEKLNGAKLVACGIANHYSLSGKLAWIEERLGQLITDDPCVISDSLAQYGDLVYVDKSSVLHNIRHDIYESRSSLQDIYAERMENLFVSFVVQQCHVGVHVNEMDKEIERQHKIRDSMEVKLQSLNQRLSAVESFRDYMYSDNSNLDQYEYQISRKLQEAHARIKDLEDDRTEQANELKQYEVESLAAARKAALSDYSHHIQHNNIAFVDRADIKAYVGPPTLQARYEILRSCLV
ncbi:hypothetical protein L1887_14558 [Cichorium endivia]|nr:hypothetical protein L1887_14558 [Cichorium endivia]